jgi:hypothetical protein
MEGCFLTNVEFAILPPQEVEEEMSVDLVDINKMSSRCMLPQFAPSAANRFGWLVSFAFYTYLRFDQDQINEQHHEIMLDVFVCELLASRALR